MKIRDVQKLRAVAVLVAVYSHLGDAGIDLQPMLRLGWPGVDLFFVISGFVITLSFVPRLPRFTLEQSFIERLGLARHAIVDFFLRRAVRILPMAFFWLLVPVVASRMFNLSGAFGNAERMRDEAFAAMTFQMNFVSMHFPHAQLAYYWSLCVEEHFYLLYPIFLVALPTPNRRLIGAFVGIAIVAFVIRPFWPVTLTEHAFHFTHRKADMILAGVVLALMRLEGWGLRPPRLSPVAGTAVFSFLLFCLWCGPTYLPMSYVVEGGMATSWMVGAALVQLASYDRGFIPGGRFFEWVGERSFAIYLIHTPVIRGLQETLFRLDLAPQSWVRTHLVAYVALGTGLTFLLAEICHVLLERPLRIKAPSVPTESAMAYGQ